MSIRKKLLKKLSRSKLSIRAQKLKPRKVKPFEDVLPVAGLNKPASIIYRALNDLGIPFRTEVPFGGGSILGGARVDFDLVGRNTVIEYNGPFHDTLEGQRRDFIRNLAVPLRRIIIIRVGDLPTIKPTLLRKLGQPV